MLPSHPDSNYKRTSYHNCSHYLTYLGTNMIDELLELEADKETGDTVEVKLECKL